MTLVAELYESEWKSYLHSSGQFFELIEDLEEKSKQILSQQTQELSQSAVFSSFSEMAKFPSAAEQVRTFSADPNKSLDYKNVGDFHPYSHN